MGKPSKNRGRRLQRVPLCGLGDFSESEGGLAMSRKLNKQDCVLFSGPRKALSRRSVPLPRRLVTNEESVRVRIAAYVDIAVCADYI